METSFGVVTTVGSVRQVNQDNFYLNGKIKKIDNKEDKLSGTSESECQLFAVADGMGGESFGEIASQIAVEALGEYQDRNIEYNWKEYIRKTNQKICEYQKEKQLNMGTTFAGLSISASKVIAINVGDTRIYQIRKGKIRQLSKDHNEYQTLMDAGIQMPERVMRMAKSHLTQFLGVPDSSFELEPHITIVDSVFEGDIYLLCSDGLYGVLPEEQIRSMICEGQKDQGMICRSLVKSAEEKGSRDNITAMIVKITNSKSGKLRQLGLHMRDFLRKENA